MLLVDLKQSKITPDIICLSKGITGGYMTLSAILTTNMIYKAFYDEYNKLNAFLHSHSYTANPIACTAACASLDLFEKIGVQINPVSRCRDLSVAEQQIVEIAKALSVDAGIIIMDEPSAVLTIQEVEQLFKTTFETTLKVISQSSFNLDPTFPKWFAKVVLLL